MRTRFQLLNNFQLRNPLFAVFSFSDTIFERSLVNELFTIVFENLHLANVLLGFGCLTCVHAKHANITALSFLAVLVLRLFLSAPFGDFLLVVSFKD